MNNIDGIELEVREHATNEEFRVRFDPEEYGVPEDHVVTSYNYYAIKFRVSKNTGNIRASSYTPTIPNELKEIAAKKVKEYLEENPREEYPSKTEKYFDDEEKVVEW